MSDVRDKIFGMSGAARAMMEQLFFNGPTWDGNVVSKSGRGELCKLGYAEHAFGHAWLTHAGVEFAINSMEMDRAKERWQDAKRKSK